LAIEKRCRLDLPGFTTALDGGSAGAVGSGSSKNLEGLTRNVLKDKAFSFLARNSCC